MPSVENSTIWEAKSVIRFTSANSVHPALPSPSFPLPVRLLADGRTACVLSRDDECEPAHISRRNVAPRRGAVASVQDGRGVEGGVRLAREEGLLSLPLLPLVVGRPRQCLQPVEARERTHQGRHRTC